MSERARRIRRARLVLRTRPTLALCYVSSASERRKCRHACKMSSKRGAVVVRKMHHEYARRMPCATYTTLQQRDNMQARLVDVQRARRSGCAHQTAAERPPHALCSVCNAPKRQSHAGMPDDVQRARRSGRAHCKFWECPPHALCYVYDALYKAATCRRAWKMSSARDACAASASRSSHRAATARVTSSRAAGSAHRRRSTTPLFSRPRT